ncbi:MAG: flagellar motor protein MotB [Deltaproteobacteria bacterium]|nr:flagellar motor protein MotB [Deltaproteobacteria bacterium]MBW1736384.1 flagellar motor protein MotB [Deltaproteobacteria bacterium]MBW1908123.1 flagellar motor protein MotB [Deltaproteobacteria bacterium]MBW2032202.1 flagellar motor protein MotB [Deltaproteobacteria bacterium]MBW2113775.1 flagellar motor protein MotB [Deltaproteobacteria bacterium]
MRKMEIKSAEQAVEEDAKWLITFNDLMTLLMVFFVLLFSMSSLDVKKLKTFQFALQSALGILEEGQNMGVGVTEPSPIPETSNQEEVVLEEGEEVTTTEEEIKDSIKALDSEPEIGVSYTKEGVVITLENTILFESAIADINPRAFAVLDKIAKIIKKTSKPIRIEGHTDDDPIHTETFPSNWELSTARAVNVVKYFVEAGKIPSQRLSAVGYGEAKPLFPNDTPEHKAGNRRVEIVLMMEEER